MSLASYQLLHSAMFDLHRFVFECKVIVYFLIGKTFGEFSFILAMMESVILVFLYMKVAKMNGILVWFLKMGVW